MGYLHAAMCSQMSSKLCSYLSTLIVENLVSNVRKTHSMQSLEPPLHLQVPRLILCEN